MEQVADGQGANWPRILSLVGHQLRGPISLIGGYTEMLATQEVQADPARTKAVMEEIRRCLLELNRLTTELQEGSRVTAGALPIRHQKLHIGSLIDEVVIAATPLCRMQNVTLDAAGARIDGYVTADPFYLKTCLLNLIDNAAKYGKPGGRVQLRTQALGDLIELVVVDDGPGLGPRAGDFFLPFAQGPEAKEGIGLGLSLVKAIVEAHGGSIVWSSGNGSSVGFTIPSSVG
jgi:signal transduction histidine kinase